MKKALSICLGALAALLLSMGQPNMERAAAIEPIAPVVIRPPIAVDGYYFDSTVDSEPVARIRIVLLKNYNEIGREWATANGGKFEKRTDGLQVVAFARWERAPDGIMDCTIYTIDPKISYRPQFIGHELMHCMYGNFHPGQPKNKP